MTEPDDEVPESPATWENVVMGEVTEVVGKVLHNHAMAEEGEDQKDIAHEVRDEYDEEHH